MVNFVNGFSISVSGDGKDVIINFAQTYPKAFSDNDEVELEHIGSFVFHEDSAVSLANAILEMVDNNDLTDADENLSNNDNSL